MTAVGGESTVLPPLLGFQWDNVSYLEDSLFGLVSAPFLFDLFTEALHWITMHTLNWWILLCHLDRCHTPLN